MICEWKELSNLDIKGNSRTFEYFEYCLCYKSDKAIIDKLSSKGKRLAERVNPAKANYGATHRNKETIEINCIAGVFAEHFWKLFLNNYSGNSIVSSCQYEGSKTQIDLVVVTSNKTIEVRSSFPRNGIEFAVFNKKYQFDVIGPYSNCIKIAEIRKDFYVRTLFPMSEAAFLKSLKTNFSIVLTGGATWKMFMDNSISKKKSLVDKESTVPENEKSEYLVIPLSLALDTKEIADLIRKSGELPLPVSQ